MKHLAVVALCFVGIVGVLAVTFIGDREERRSLDTPDRPDHDGIGPFMDDSIATGQPYKVSCGTVDGGTASDLMVDVDGGQRYTQTDYLVQNKSTTTCVRVGLGSRTDENHGVEIGTACSPAAPSTTTMHAKVGKCKSEGAAVVVDVLGGHP